MASVNKVILIGNLGQPPDVRITNSGSKVAEISLATTSYFTRDNERVEKTQWHTVTLWNKLAEIVERYTGKGSNVYIEGRLETEKWQDQNGQNRYTTKVIAESIQLLGSNTRR
ncbi:single-stranded DNA-binding protein [Parasutterella excrementihominis]|uniref:single-stranded DNA-binding protein n=1 Tax=Parasutterella excrementihominis TaxID=487175 RepID=UPI00243047FC|nr:single-stranded DNA-binding protein [Parasutterella excrementihominis]